MEFHAEPTRWRRPATAQERRQRQLLLCRRGVHGELTSDGCGWFQRRCRCCGQLFEAAAGRFLPSGPNPALTMSAEPTAASRKRDQ